MGEFCYPLVVSLMIGRVHAIRCDHASRTPFIFVTATPHGDCTHDLESHFLGSTRKEFVHLFIQMTCALSVDKASSSNVCEGTNLDGTRIHSGREPPTPPRPGLFCVHEWKRPGWIPKVPCSSDALSVALHSWASWGENPQRTARM